MKRDEFLDAVATEIIEMAEEEDARVEVIFAEDASTDTPPLPVELAFKERLWSSDSSTQENDEFEVDYDSEYLLVVGSADDGTHWNNGCGDLSGLRRSLIEEDRLRAFVSLPILDSVEYSYPEHYVPHKGKGRSLWLFRTESPYTPFGTPELCPLIGEIATSSEIANAYPILDTQSSPKPDNFDFHKAVYFLADLVWNQRIIPGISCRINGSAFAQDDTRPRPWGIDTCNFDESAMEFYDMGPEYHVRSYLTMNFNERFDDTQYMLSQLPRQAAPERVHDDHNATSLKDEDNAKLTLIKEAPFTTVPERVFGNDLYFVVRDTPDQPYVIHGSLERVIEEFCGAAAYYPYTLDGVVHENYELHEHFFEDVLKVVLDNPEAFSLSADQQACYGAQQLNTITAFQHALLKARLKQ